VGGASRARIPLEVDEQDAGRLAGRDRFLAIGSCIAPGRRCRYGPRRAGLPVARARSGPETAHGRAEGHGQVSLRSL